jgi:Mn-dependent DtxR family transcriptional regulator
MVMGANPGLMLEPRQLNDADRSVLSVLAGDGGRMRPTHIATQADVERSYCAQRLKRLHEHGHVDKPYSGLYILTDDPREGSADD